MKNNFLITFLFLSFFVNFTSTTGEHSADAQGTTPIEQEFEGLLPLASSRSESTGSYINTGNPINGIVLLSMLFAGYAFKDNIYNFGACGAKKITKLFNTGKDYAANFYNYTKGKINKLINRQATPEEIASLTGIIASPFIVYFIYSKFLSNPTHEGFAFIKKSAKLIDDNDNLKKVAAITFAALGIGKLGYDFLSDDDDKHDSKN